MECEMCGKSVGTRRYMVDGTMMQLGACCGKYGTPMDTPTAAPAGSKAAMTQNLEKRQQRMQTRSVYTDDVWDLVPQYGTRIREAREKKGLSHDQLGNKVSARVPQLKQIEANGLRPSDELARKFERELGISILEKVDGSANAMTGAPAQAKGKALTMGDLLKQAMDKKGN